MAIKCSNSLAGLGPRPFQNAKPVSNKKKKRVEVTINVCISYFWLNSCFPLVECNTTK